MKRKIGMIDLTSGELLEGVSVHVRSTRQPTIYGNRWVQMSQEAQISLAADKELWGRPRAVFDYLLGVCGYENYVKIEQQEIADALKIHRPDVTKAIAKLVEKKLISLGPKEGKSNTYRINQYYCWKGSNKKAREYQYEVINGGKS